MTGYATLLTTMLITFLTTAPDTLESILKHWARGREFFLYTQEENQIVAIFEEFFKMAREMARDRDYIEIYGYNPRKPVLLIILSLSPFFF